FIAHFLRTVGGLLFQAQTILRSLEDENRKKRSRMKWGGLAMVLLGLATTMASCPFYAITLIGPETVLVGLGLLVVGGFLMFLRPRIKDTSRAMMVALKYGNVLTVPRLALEMDISFDKAEKIIKEMVQKDIAEIDLDHKDSDDSLVYRIKGL
ncbi:PepSY domain-containing protein, partial [Thermodesulfobacteriota bacterium]